MERILHPNKVKKDISEKLGRAPSKKRLQAQPRWTKSAPKT